MSTKQMVLSLALVSAGVAPMFRVAAQVPTERALLNRDGIASRAAGIAVSSATPANRAVTGAFALLGGGTALPEGLAGSSRGPSVPAATPRCPGHGRALLNRPA